MTGKVSRTPLLRGSPEMLVSPAVAPEVLVEEKPAVDVALPVSETVLLDMSQLVTDGFAEIDVRIFRIIKEHS